MSKYHMGNDDVHGWSSEKSIIDAIYWHDRTQREDAVWASSRGYDLSFTDYGQWKLLKSHGKFVEKSYWTSKSDALIHKHRIGNDGNHPSIHDWLVVFRLALWKIWVRQLGWWLFPTECKNKPCSSHHEPNDSGLFWCLVMLKNRWFLQLKAVSCPSGFIGTMCCKKPFLFRDIWWTIEAHFMVQFWKKLEMELGFHLSALKLVLR